MTSRTVGDRRKQVKQKASKMRQFTDALTTNIPFISAVLLKALTIYIDMPYD